MRLTHLFLLEVCMIFSCKTSTPTLNININLNSGELERKHVKLNVVPTQSESKNKESTKSEEQKKLDTDDMNLSVLSPSEVNAFVDLHFGTTKQPLTNTLPRKDTNEYNFPRKSTGAVKKKNLEMNDFNISPIPSASKKIPKDNKDTLEILDKDSADETLETRIRKADDQCECQNTTNNIPEDNPKTDEENPKIFIAKPKDLLIQSCSFCSKKLKNEKCSNCKPMQIICNHSIFMHNNCMKTWLAGSHQCPTCHKKYDSKESEALALQVKEIETLLTQSAPNQTTILATIKKEKGLRLECCWACTTALTLIAGFVSLAVGYSKDIGALKNLGIVESVVSIIMLFLWVAKLVRQENRSGSIRPDKV